MQKMYTINKKNIDIYRKSYFFNKELVKNLIDLYAKRDFLIENYMGEISKRKIITINHLIYNLEKEFIIS